MNGDLEKADESIFSPSLPTTPLEPFSTSPFNPRNWSKSKKWRITLTVSVTSFIVTSGSSIGVPALHAAMHEFGETEAKIGLLTIASYVLGLGSGPFLSAPISELYGRQPAYLCSMLLFGLFCLGTAVSQSMPSLIVLRFFCGMFGSTSPSLGVATVADLWSPQERGRPMSIYGMGPMAGPVMGSMLGYWILNGGWRWDFWVITIVALVNFVAFVLLTDETHAQTIEKILQNRSPKALGRKLTHFDALRCMKNMVSREEAKQVFSAAFSRPPRLLFTNPVCMIFSAYYAYLYAIIYLFIVSVPLMFGAPPFDRPSLFSYGWSLNILPFAYIGLAIGFGLAGLTGAMLQDRIYRHLSKRAGNPGVGQPEYRFGACLLPIGLFIFGWTAQNQTHWMGPQVGMFFIAYGLATAFPSIQTFIADAFFPYSAAAIAAATALRSIAACVLPIFSGDMFENLGWGLGGTVLACIALAGVPAPTMMFIWGGRLRGRFKFEG